MPMGVFTPEAQAIMNAVASENRIESKTRMIFARTKCRRVRRR